MTLLNDELIFPESRWASPDGIVAIGGDLSVERLVLAYSNGIFPWYNEGSEILWWTPDPRFVLETKNIKVSKSMRQVIRSKRFKVTFDTQFQQVIQQCKSSARNGQEGTWITQDMENAYILLHEAGHAHSVEVWEENDLVGGLYGVSLGKMFFGESMFAKVSNASKFGFIQLVERLVAKGFEMIDCQDYTAHLESLGAEEISRRSFEIFIQEKIEEDGKMGSWTNWLT
jgi:leucyl/phenylalanyl-tRNA--protein transferase